MYELNEIFTGKPDDIIEIMAKTIEKTMGLKAGTRTNLEYVKRFCEQYLKQVEAVLALLNNEDHSIVISHLSEAKKFLQEVTAELSKQLDNHSDLY